VASCSRHIRQANCSASSPRRCTPASAGGCCARLATAISGSIATTATSSSRRSFATGAWCTERLRQARHGGAAGDGYCQHRDRPGRPALSGAPAHRTRSAARRLRERRGTAVVNLSRARDALLRCGRERPAWVGAEGAADTAASCRRLSAACGLGCPAVPGLSCGPRRRCAYCGWTPADFRRSP